MIARLKQIPLFSQLPEEDLARLQQMGRKRSLPVGEVLYKEGELGHEAYIILEGALEVSMQSGERQVLLGVQQEGDVVGESALLDERQRLTTASAREDTLLFSVDRDHLLDLLRSSPTAGEAMFMTVLARWRETESMLRHNEKMAQLGDLSAGVAHELNNPAAAVQRGASQLAAALDELGQAYANLVALQMTAEVSRELWAFTARVRQQAKSPLVIDLVARTDMELQFENWLDQRGIGDTWELSAPLINAGFKVGDLVEIEDHFQGKRLAVAMTWLAANFETYRLLAEIQAGSGQISHIVNALKGYAYLDRSPVQDVDIHQGLENTLLILRHRRQGDVRFIRDYAPELPMIRAYGSELNQVWTNLVSNALDAVGESGAITLKTRREGERVVVSVSDDGSGIPEEILPRIFDPYFTTKPSGVGMGLGLDICYAIIVHKHYGEIRVESKPGRTCFDVWLPIDLQDESM